MSLTSVKHVTAKVINGALVASFHASNPPTVWRLDLDKTPSFAIAIQKRGEDWELGLASAKGELATVARFAEREDVDAAWAVVERAMLCDPRSLWRRVMRIAAVTTVVLGLITGALWALRMMPAVEDMAPTSSSATMMGEPVDADAALQGR